MGSTDVPGAIAAARSIASSLGVPADDAVILHDSNRLTVRLKPGDVLARVSREDHQAAQLEIDIARRLAGMGCPVGAVAPDVEPNVHTRDGFVVTLWTYYEPATPSLSAAAYANALEELHAGMSTLDVPSPRFTDRVTEAADVVAARDLSPELTDGDRKLLASTLEGLRQAVTDRAAPEQLLHGEPHPGNVLSTDDGPVFIDFETCCRGPVEFDLAHVPSAVAEHYSGIDQGMLADCRQLALAMVAAWRWELGDQFPNGRWFGEEFLRCLRRGPPWPTIDEVTSRLDR